MILCLFENFQPFPLLGISQNEEGGECLRLSHNILRINGSYPIKFTSLKVRRMEKFHLSSVSEFGFIQELQLKSVDVTSGVVIIYILILPIKVIFIFLPINWTNQRTRVRLYISIYIHFILNLLSKSMYTPYIFQCCSLLTFNFFLVKCLMYSTKLSRTNRADTTTRSIVNSMNFHTNLYNGCYTSKMIILFSEFWLEHICLCLLNVRIGFLKF